MASNNERPVYTEELMFAADVIRFMFQQYSSGWDETLNTSASLNVGGNKESVFQIYDYVQLLVERLALEEMVEFQRLFAEYPDVEKETLNQYHLLISKALMEKDATINMDNNLYYKVMAREFILYCVRIALFLHFLLTLRGVNAIEDGLLLIDRVLRSNGRVSVCYIVKECRTDSTSGNLNVQPSTSSSDSRIIIYRGNRYASRIAALERVLHTRKILSMIGKKCKEIVLDEIDKHISNPVDASINVERTERSGIEIQASSSSLDKENVRPKSSKRRQSEPQALSVFQAPTEIEGWMEVEDWMEPCSVKELKDLIESEGSFESVVLAFLLKKRLDRENLIVDIAVKSFRESFVMHLNVSESDSSSSDSAESEFLWAHEYESTLQTAAKELNELYDELQTAINLLYNINSGSTTSNISSPEESQSLTLQTGSSEITIETFKRDFLRDTEAQERKTRDILNCLDNFRKLYSKMERRRLGEASTSDPSQSPSEDNRNFELTEEEKSNIEHCGRWKPDATLFDMTPETLIMHSESITAKLLNLKSTIKNTMDFLGNLESSKTSSNICDSEATQSSNLQRTQSSEVTMETSEQDVSSDTEILERIKREILDCEDRVQELVSNVSSTEEMIMSCRESLLEFRSRMERQRTDEANTSDTKQNRTTQLCKDSDATVASDKLQNPNPELMMEDSSKSSPEENLEPTEEEPSDPETSKPPPKRKRSDKHSDSDEDKSESGEKKKTLASDEPGH